MSLLSFANRCASDTKIYGKNHLIERLWCDRAFVRARQDDDDFHDGITIEPGVSSLSGCDDARLQFRRRYPAWTVGRAARQDGPPARRSIARGASQVGAGQKRTTRPPPPGRTAKVSSDSAPPFPPPSIGGSGARRTISGTSPSNPQGSIPTKVPGFEPPAVAHRQARTFAHNEQGRT